MQELTFIISIGILIVSIVLHELAHGYTAELLGDPTPRLQGRLTINPLRHVDIFGSIVVPIITALAGFAFGWAKPIEWNPYNVKNRRLGEFLISLAGPATNLLIAIVFGFTLRYGIGFFPEGFLKASVLITIINIGLAVFNLIPIPPLDGSKILFSLLPSKFMYIRDWIERYSIFLILVLVFFLWQYFEPIIPYLFRLITGLNFS